MTARFEGLEEMMLTQKYRLTLPGFIRDQLPDRTIYVQDLGDATSLYLMPSTVIDEEISALPAPWEKDFDNDELLRLLGIRGALTCLKLDNLHRINVRSFVKPRDISPGVNLTFVGCDRYALLYLGDLSEFRSATRQLVFPSAV